jgi:hypothetical protein
MKKILVLAALNLFINQGSAMENYSEEDLNKNNQFLNIQMNNEIISFSEGKKVSIKSFDKPLAQLLVDVYSMQWDKEKQSQIKETCVDLSKRIAFLSNDQIQINIEKEMKSHSYSKAIKSMKDFMANEIQAIHFGTPTFKYISTIYGYLLTEGLIDEKQAENICDALSKDISIKQKEEEADNQHKLAIQELLGKTLGINTVNIKKNELSGANAGFVVTAEDKRKYFIKTFSEAFGSPSSSTKKIDCREIFAYKVLEYLGFGPETECLTQAFSSSRGSKAQGGYIVTRDVTTIHSHYEQNKEFFRDADENDSEYEEAIAKKEFSVELFAIASLNSILRLRDTFGDNPGNYGIIKTIMKDEIIKYEPILIDHLPCTSNGIIDGSYSPGSFLKIKFESSLEKSLNLGKVIWNIEKKNNNGFSSKKNDLAEEVMYKVMNGKKDFTLEKSIGKAFEYVQKEIDKNSDCFTDEENKNGYFTAKEMLNKHVERVMDNYKMFLSNYK